MDVARKLKEAALAKLEELKTRDKCEKAYLDFVKDWQVYGSTFWHVQPQGTMEFPSHVIMAIHPKGVLIINPDTFEILKSYKYNEIPQWGSSKSSFVLYVGNLIKQTKTFFSTPTETQGDEMNVRCWAHLQPCNSAFPPPSFFSSSFLSHTFYNTHTHTHSLARVYTGYDPCLRHARSSSG